MKLLVEVIVSIVLHPIAMVLAWINSAGRSDLGAGGKIAWGVVNIIWGLGPILYVLLGGGTLW